MSDRDDDLGAEEESMKILGRKVVLDDGLPVDVIEMRAVREKYDVAREQAVLDRATIKHLMSERDRALAAAKELRAALIGVAATHDGYQLGVGPCVCAAHQQSGGVLARTAWVDALEERG